MCFFLISQGSIIPKIRFLGQKVCSVAHLDTQTDTKVITVGTLSRFQEFFLQPIIKKHIRPNIDHDIFITITLTCILESGRFPECLIDLRDILKGLMSLLDDPCDLTDLLCLCSLCLMPRRALHICRPVPALRRSRLLYKMRAMRR